MNESVHFNHGSSLTVFQNFVKLFLMAITFDSLPFTFQTHYFTGSALKDQITPILKNYFMAEYCLATEICVR